jgi:hypothetical protein
MASFSCRDQKVCEGPDKDYAALVIPSDSSSLVKMVSVCTKAFKTVCRFREGEIKGAKILHPGGIFKPFALCILQKEHSSQCKKRMDLPLANC